MSDVIQLLPDSVANQIAAGEVIQRPASVIKELVENAVDAGAKTVNVLVEDAGRTSLQVIDDGCGMSDTDARLAFERHATSKIRQAADLFTLHTMGFRGEALPSIVAVAQVELRTRRPQDDVGTLLRMAASRVQSQEPCSCPVGSSFKVSNLFFNIPARRKFLKSNATELNHILQAFERIVLVYPDITFTLHSNGQELLNLRAGTLRQRIADVFGRRYSQDLLPLQVDTTLCRITGFTGKPEAARKKGAHEFFFVNGRYMRHPYFHRAVQQAYERLVTAGAHVPYFIYFDVAPADIDVNIHPTKTEIKFENEQPIWQILAAAVKDAIGQFSEIPQIDFDTEGRPDIPAYNPSAAPAYNPSAAPAYNPSAVPAYNPFRSVPSPRHWESLFPDPAGPLSPDGSAAAAPSCSVSRGSSAAYETSAASPASAGPLSPAGSAAAFSVGRGSAAAGSASAGSAAPVASLPDDLAPSHYQYKGRYILTAVKSGLLVIDQHRADVRIRYDRYLRHLTDAPAPSQRLLFPEALELSAAEAAALPALLPSLQAVGFALSADGSAVTAMPAGLEGLRPAALVRDLLAASHDQPSDPAAPLSPAGSAAAFSVGRGSAAAGSPVAPALHHGVALALARRAAIPYGQLLTAAEMDALVNDLFQCSDVNHTPDGHAILAILPQHDLDALLG